MTGMRSLLWTLVLLGSVLLTVNGVPWLIAAAWILYGVWTTWE